MRTIWFTIRNKENGKLIKTAGVDSTRAGKLLEEIKKEIPTAGIYYSYRSI